MPLDLYSHQGGSFNPPWPTSEESNSAPASGANERAGDLATYAPNDAIE
jgi:hypothetical protein